MQTTRMQSRPSKPRSMLNWTRAERADIATYVASSIPRVLGDFKWENPNMEVLIPLINLAVHNVLPVNRRKAIDPKVDLVWLTPLIQARYAPPS